MSFDSWTLTLISFWFKSLQLCLARRLTKHPTFFLVSASLGNEKKANSPEADVFLHSFTQQYLMLLYWTVQHNWMEMPPFYT